MNKKVLSLFFVIFISVFSSNVFAKANYTVREWDGEIFNFLYDNWLRVFDDDEVIDALFAEDRSDLEKYRATRIIVDLLRRIDIISLDSINDSDAFLKYFVEKLDDNYLKLTLSDYLDAGVFVAYGIDEKQGNRKEFTFEEIVVLLRALVNEEGLPSGFDETAKVGAFEIRMATRIKELIQASSWYEKRKNDEIIKRTIEVIDDLIKKQDSEAGANFCNHVHFLRGEVTKKTDDRYAEKNTKKISFFEYFRDETVRIVFKKYINIDQVARSMCVNYLEPNYGIVANSLELLDIDDFFEVMVENAELTGTEIYFLLDKVKRSDKELSLSVIYSLLAQLDPRDEDNMLKNLWDLIAMIDGGVCSTDCNADGTIDFFNHYDVEWYDKEYGIELSFDIRFFGTMDTFFQKNKTDTSVDEELVSIFIGYLIKKRYIDSSTLQSYLDIIEKSAWFKNIETQQLKLVIEALRLKIKGQDDCVRIFSTKTL